MVLSFQVLKISNNDNTNENYESFGFFKNLEQAKMKIDRLVGDFIIYKKGKEYLDLVSKLVKSLKSYKEIENTISEGFFYFVDGKIFRVFEKKKISKVDSGWIYNSQIEEVKVEMLFKFVVVEVDIETANIVTESYLVKKEGNNFNSVIDELKQKMKQTKHV